MIWMIFHIYCYGRYIKICNPSKKHKILIISDDMIAEMLSNKKHNPIVSELFMIGR